MHIGTFKERVKKKPAKSWKSHENYHSYWLQKYKQLEVCKTTENKRKLFILIGYTSKLPFVSSYSFCLIASHKWRLVTLNICNSSYTLFSWNLNVIYLFIQFVFILWDCLNLWNNYLPILLPLCSDTVSCYLIQVSCYYVN